MWKSVAHYRGELDTSMD